MNKIIFNLLFIVFIGIFTNANAQISDNYYDVKIESEINKNISSNVENSNIKIIFKNKDLYNEQVKFSYHITDLSGKSIQFENERIPFQIDENGIGTAKLSINFDNLTTPIDNNKFVIQFDLIDEKNLYWFKSNNAIKLESNDILYDKPSISHPKEIIKNSVEDNKVNDLNNITMNMISNKYVFIVNILLILFIIILFIIYKNSNKKVKKCSDIYIQDENENIDYDNKVLYEEHDSILYKFGNNLFKSTNDKILKLERKIINLNWKVDGISYLVSQIGIDIQNLIKHLNEKTNNLDEVILGKNGLMHCEVNKQPWSNKILYSYYINSTDVNQENTLFNDIPYEVFLDKISCYKDIVAIGQTSKEFIEYIGYGEYMKNGAYEDSNEENNGLCPVSLIGINAKKSQAMLITNHNLSMVIIRSANILEELNDKITDALYLPVMLRVNSIEVEWKNFSWVEKTFNSYMRWAIDFDNNSSIIIQNNTPEKIKADLSFSVHTPQIDATISFKVNGNMYNYSITNEKLKINFNMELMSGKNEIEFVYSGEKQQIGTDPRQLKFSIIGLNIFPENQNTITINEIYGYNSISAKSEDSIIRKRLHSIGFYEIASDVIANKGLYRNNISSSVLNVNDEYDSNENFLSEIRKIAIELKREYIPILYEAYRKKVTNN